MVGGNRLSKPTLLECGTVAETNDGVAGAANDVTLGTVATDGGVVVVGGGGAGEVTPMPTTDNVDVDVDKVAASQRSPSGGY